MDIWQADSLRERMPKAERQVEGWLIEGLVIRLHLQE
jgi:hypothetical protein